VLDIDRERQRISLGLKQTQTDPWQQVVDSYREDDVVEGRVAKVVTFGAFVEILPGVEGLVHISELATHHVENPREVVSQGQAVNVRILEIDGERRRLSLSLKRVEEADQPVPRADGAESVHETPDLKLSEEAFPAGGPAPVEADVEADTAERDTDEPDEAGALEAVADQPEAEAEAEAEAPEAVEADTEEPDEAGAPEAIADQPEAEAEAAAMVVEENIDDEPSEPAEQAEEAEQTES